MHALAQEHVEECLLKYNVEHRRSSWIKYSGSASEPAVDQRKKDSSMEAGKAVMNLVRENIRPSDILTKKAFENAVTLVVAMGGSTNTALHLPAIANEMGISLTLNEHDISMRTPLLADLKQEGNM